MEKKNKNIDQKMIAEYLAPELTNLKALLKGFQLTESLTALIFLQKIIKNELKHYGN